MGARSACSNVETREKERGVDIELHTFEFSVIVVSVYGVKKEDKNDKRGVKNFI